MEYFMEKRDWTRLLDNTKFEQVKKFKNTFNYREWYEQKCRDQGDIYIEEKTINKPVN